MYIVRNDINRVDFLKNSKSVSLSRVLDRAIVKMSFADTEQAFESGMRGFESTEKLTIEYELATLARILEALDVQDCVFVLKDGQKRAMVFDADRLKPEESATSIEFIKLEQLEDENWVQAADTVDFDLQRRNANPPFHWVTKRKSTRALPVVSGTKSNQRFKNVVFQNFLASLASIKRPDDNTDFRAYDLEINDKFLTPLLRTVHELQRFLSKQGEFKSLDVVLQSGLLQFHVEADQDAASTASVQSHLQQFNGKEFLLQAEQAANDKRVTGMWRRVRSGVDSNKTNTQNRRSVTFSHKTSSSAAPGSTIVTSPFLSSGRSTAAATSNRQSTASRFGYAPPSFSNPTLQNTGPFNDDLTSSSRPRSSFGSSKTSSTRASPVHPADLESPVFFRIKDDLRNTSNDISPALLPRLSS